VLGGLFNFNAKSGPSAAEMSTFDTFINGLSGRAAGGSVAAGGMYRVNEQGPELLDVNGKQFLMMGGRGGSVTPNHDLGGTTINNFTVGDVATVSMLKQAVAASQAQSAQALSRSRDFGGPY
jgi:hypothetical protein